MKYKITVLLLGLLCLTGCNKYKGTWCRYVEIYSTLIVTKENITETELANLKSTIETLKDVKSYDVMEDIEKANTTITIYYLTNENLDENESMLHNISSISSIENKSFITPAESLIITDDTFTYGTNLDNVSAVEDKGTYTTDKNTLLLTEINKSLFYKNKYLCTDAECTTFLEHSKSDTCDHQEIKK